MQTKGMTISLANKAHSKMVSLYAVIQNYVIVKERPKYQKVI